MNGMKRALLATAICAVLYFGASSCANAAAVPPDSTDQAASPPSNDSSQDSEHGKDRKKAKTLDGIIVTGSLIPQSQLQTASPVITITAADIEKQGYKTVYDALHAQPVATGSVQDSQFQGGDTQAANTISLFGLDPGFTLVLINGHPVADYPIPYKGTGNIVDLATIPTSMVDRIDILSGGQSSLYGSSAIAGVINIVLKQHAEGINVSVRTGTYTEGGGQNESGSVSGGWSHGSLDVNYAVQLDDQRPIWGFERSFADSALDDPSGQGFPRRVFWRNGIFAGQYVDPGAATCASVGDLFGGSVGYDYIPGRGYYCGSDTEAGYFTLMNSNHDADGYLNVTYHLNDYNDAYAEIEYGYSRPTIGSGAQFWDYTNPQLAHGVNGLTDFFWNNTTQDLEYWQRQISPEEMGGLDVDQEKVLTRQYNVNVGARGSLAQTDWDYDAYYNRSQVNTDSSQLWPLNAPFIQYYLGVQQGTDPYGYGIAAYTPNVQRFYTPLTPAQFLSFSDYIKSQSVSWTQDATAVVTNADLFKLPAGPVGIAGVVQYGNQAFDNPIDPRVQAGDFVGQYGTSGSGERDHAALGSEMRLPLSRQFIADASVRYDDYRTDFRDDAKPTYKLGLEYRPVDTLLMRATYATAFRAPDMEYLFAKDSGLQENVTDWYQCRTTLPHTPINQCPNDYDEFVFALDNGSNALKSVTSQSFGYGLVFSPTDRFNIKVDYQRIGIDNEIQPLDTDTLLQTEADCRIGHTPSGQKVVVDSPTCLDALARVVRYPTNYPVTAVADQIEQVDIGPVNIANESLDGIQSSADYKLDIGRFGHLDLGANYYLELHHRMQNKPGDPIIDLLHDYNSTEFKSKAGATATWTIGPWATTLHAQYDGSSVNADQSGKIGSFTTWNASVRYQIPSRGAYVQLTANNLFDRHPPPDGGAGWPFYNTLNYQGYGRAVFLELGMHFGEGSPKS